MLKRRTHENSGSDTDVDSPPACPPLSSDTSAPSPAPSPAQPAKRMNTAIKRVAGDIVAATEQFIVHQCNCVSKAGKGLSQTVFTRFPYADVYAARARTRSDDKSKVGTVIVSGDGSGSKRYVVNLLGQIYPGGPKYANDSAEKRVKWFEQALTQLAGIVQEKGGDKAATVAFPYKIGCGLAGGSWPQYEQLIERFAERSGAQVSIYQLPGTPDQ